MTCIPYASHLRYVIIPFVTNISNFQNALHLSISTTTCCKLLLICSILVLYLIFSHYHVFSPLVSGGHRHIWRMWCKLHSRDCFRTICGQKIVGEASNGECCISGRDERNSRPFHNKSSD